MTRIKLMGLALVAIFAFSAIAATAASAVEGPFLKVEGSRLGAGETRLLLASAKENFILTAAAGPVITCKTTSLPIGSEMQIIGSAGKNGGTSLEAIAFGGCTQEKNGEACTVENEKIQTNLVVNLLGYASETRGGPILVLFAPDTGKVFVTVKFSGTCTFPTTSVEGTVIGLARVGGVNVQPGAGTEKTHGEVTFDNVGSTIWLEKEGVLTSVKSGMKAFGLAANLKGTALLLVDLASGPVNWGVFTQ